MNKKTYIVLLSIISVLVISTINVSAYDGTLIITDETGDIEKTDKEGNTTINNVYPDIDLETLSFKQNGKQLDVIFKLVEEGKFKEDITTAFIIQLFTTSNNVESDIDAYQIFYSSIGEIINETGNPFIILYTGLTEEFITVDEYTGIGTNTLEFSFDLVDKNQRLLSPYVLTNKESGGNYYSDDYPQGWIDYGDISEFFEIEIDAGGQYNVKAGQSIELSGTVISGDINNDYEWFWTFDDSSITLEGQNPPPYTFKIPDTYTGKLYIYDGKGSCSLDTFEVNVTGINTNSGNNNEQPGFELIFIILAAAIALLIFRKKKK